MNLKNKKKNILIGILVISIITFLGFTKYKKFNIENFEAKFLACKMLEIETLHDNINGIISEKEYVDEMRVHLQNYKDIKESVPSDFKKEYEEWLEIANSNIVNYDVYDKDNKDKEMLKMEILIDKFNEENEKRNIDIDKRNEKVEKYTKEFRR